MHRAYVDESEPGGGLDHSAYVLAAVVIAADAHELARTAIAIAMPKRMRKLHWYEALPGQRLVWLDLLEHADDIVVVRYEGPPARTERRRRHCIERLVWELEQRGVRSLIFESRGPARDRSDVSLLESLRARGFGQSIRYDHVRGDLEPLLGLADIACGAHVHDVELCADLATVVGAGR